MKFPAAFALLLAASAGAARAPGDAAPQEDADPWVEVRGPARICLNETAFELLEGETAFPIELGFHVGRIGIEGPDGEVELAEGSSWVPPRRSVTLAQMAGIRISRIRRSSYALYAIWAPTRWSPDAERPVMWVTGSGLDGTRRDLALLRRISLQGTDSPSCRHRFYYGFGEDSSEERGLAQ
jgi:hypothetical protein